LYWKKGEPGPWIPRTTARARLMSPQWTSSEAHSGGLLELGGAANRARRHLPQGAEEVEEDAVVPVMPSMKIDRRRCGSMMAAKVVTAVGPRCSGARLITATA
jgi:hypothetical protein